MLYVSNSLSSYLSSRMICSKELEKGHSNLTQRRVGFDAFKNSKLQKNFNDSRFFGIYASNKTKTSKSAAKRYKITTSGKVSILNLNLTRIFSSIKK